LERWTFSAWRLIKEFST